MNTLLNTEIAQGLDNRRKIAPTGLFLSILALYLIILHLMGSFCPLNILFVILVAALYFFHSSTRTFIFLAAPVLIQNLIYDFLRYIPFDWLGTVQVEIPYRIEQTLFGITKGGTVLLPHEFLAGYVNPVFDLFLGFLYNIQDLYLFFVIIFIWHFKGKDVAFRFGIAFLIMNLACFVTWFVIPVAPPWYVSKFGFMTPFANIPGDAAGLVNFDQILGITLSRNMYEMSAFVFGAFPSMHAGYATLMLLYTATISKQWAILMSVYTLLMFVSAAYLQHHYMIDVLGGILYALLGWYLAERPLRLAAKRMYGTSYNWLVAEGVPPLIRRREYV